MNARGDGTYPQRAGKAGPGVRYPEGWGGIGFTLLELLCVIALIGILAALLLPALAAARARARSIACGQQLHQAGVAFQSFAHDHNSLFPMRVSANAGGALEVVQAAYRLDGDLAVAYRPFQALSNDLSSPRIFACPADTRTPAAGFATFGNANLSYFIALNADYNQPGGSLAGDRNITSDGAASMGLLRLVPGWVPGWDGEMHRWEGNLLYADGRVERIRSFRTRLDKGQFALAADLALPTLPAVWGNPRRDAPASYSSAAVPASVARPGEGGGAVAVAGDMCPRRALEVGPRSATPAGAGLASAVTPLLAWAVSNRVARTAAPTAAVAPVQGASEAVPVPVVAAGPMMLGGHSLRYYCYLWLLVALLVSSILLSYYGVRRPLRRRRLRRRA